MTSSARAGAVAAALLAIIAAAIAFAARDHDAGRREPPGERPALLLLTSLPLMFGEDFSIDGGGSPALAAMQSRYRVLPISVTERAELAKGHLLLMAHPRAQTAENLVALDDWVRAGGRVLLLADPMLEWPSERPLGDRLRPPPMFADTGLLGHWGLRLDAPDRRGLQRRKLGNYDVIANSPGSLAGSCAIESGGLVARCAIGKGKATIVADADLLDVGSLRGEKQRNLEAVIAELAQLDRR